MEVPLIFTYLLLLVFYFNVQVLTIPNNITRGPHSCQRECVFGQTMTCKYTLAVSNFVTLGGACLSCPHNKEHCKRYKCIPANNLKRTITVINYQYPGPIIDVCHGDTIVAELQNRMLTESTLMHWHGMYQTNTPYMDGMDFVTQLPLVQANEFRYTFEADPYGTNFFHSHIAFQRMDGVIGPLIIRIPDELNRHRRLYDYDLVSHIIIIQDWNNIRGLDKQQLYINGGGSASPDALLINGLGRFEFFNHFSNKTDFMDPARFRVQKGYRYRMRVINAGVLNCPVEMSIDKHRLMLISSDGYDFEPVYVESFTSYPGETYDFVLNADQDGDVFWMKFRGGVDCIIGDSQISQVAVLDYTNNSDEIYPQKEPTFDRILSTGKHYNPVHEENIPEHDIIHTNDLVHAVQYENELKEKADFTYFMRISNIGFSGMSVGIPQLDYITSTVGTYVLLPQRDLLDYDGICNFTSTKNCKIHRCVCEHMIMIPLDDVVELILVDEVKSFMPHTFHLHGYSVRVIASDSFNRPIQAEEIQDMYYNGTIKKNLRSPVIKDTFLVPANGYTIIRFKASNAGYWFFHCHMDLHMEMGMHCTFKIGKNSDMPPVPEDYPVNARYLPDDEVL